MEHHKHRQIKLGTIIESSCEFCGKVGRVVYRVDPASEGDRGVVSHFQEATTPQGRFYP